MRRFDDLGSRTSTIRALEPTVHVLIVELEVVLMPSRVIT